MIHFTNFFLILIILFEFFQFFFADFSKKITIPLQTLDQEKNSN